MHTSEDFTARTFDAISEKIYLRALNFALQISYGYTNTAANKTHLPAISEIIAKATNELQKYEHRECSS
jgi:hypothetical protein